MDTDLSRREVEVVTLLADGLTSKEIANNLYISNHTAITHIKNIRIKLGARNAANIVFKFFKNK